MSLGIPPLFHMSAFGVLVFIPPQSIKQYRFVSRNLAGQDKEAGSQGRETLMCSSPGSKVPAGLNHREIDLPRPGFCQQNNISPLFARSCTSPPPCPLHALAVPWPWLAVGSWVASWAPPDRYTATKIIDWMIFMEDSFWILA